MSIKKAGAGKGASAKPVKLIIQAGKATPAPPVGPALSQRGVVIMDFCKQFNAETQKMEGPIPVAIHVLPEKKFKIEYKTQPASYLIMKKIGLKKGASKTGTEVVAKIKASELKEIAEVKMKDLYAKTIEDVITMLSGTAKSMGIEVENDL